MTVSDKSMKKRYISFCLFFYITLIILPVFAFSGADLKGAYAAFFKIPALNYLLYAAPGVLCVFFVKSKALLNKQIFYNYAFILILEALIILYGLKNAAGSYTFAFAGILLISAALINFNELAACLILIPGIFIKNLSFGYIIGAYFPVLILLAVSFFQGRKNPEKKSSAFLFPAYCYIAVLAAVLTAAKILIIRFNSALNLNTARDYMNFVFGIVLVAAAFVIFCLSSFPLLKSVQTGIILKVLTVFAGIYPLTALGTGLLTSFISPDFKTVILFVLLLYAVQNIHFNFTFENQFAPPAKLTEKPAAAFAAAILFCGFTLGNTL